MTRTRRPRIESLAGREITIADAEITGRRISAVLRRRSLNVSTGRNKIGFGASVLNGSPRGKEGHIHGIVRFAASNAAAVRHRRSIDIGRPEILGCSDSDYVLSGTGYIDRLRRQVSFIA